MLEVWQSWRRSANQLPILSSELVSLHIEEGRVADAREMMTRVVVVGDGSCGVGGGNQFVVTQLQLRIAALARDVVGGRTAFEAILAGPRPHDDWYVTTDVVEMVWGALAVEIPADEIRRRVFGEFLATHPALDQLAAMSEGLLLMSEQHHHAAIVSLGEAIDGWRDTLQRPLVGTLLVTMAQAQQAVGDRAGARASVDQALEALANWPGWRR
jgi:hypothetical protein